MSHDRRARYVFGVMACIALMVVSTGCRRSPFHRLGEKPTIGPDGRREGFQEPLSALDQASNSRSSAASPATVPASVEPAREAWETSLAAAIPVSAEPVGDASEIVAEQTPLLDAALKRAEAVEEAHRQAMQAEALRPEPAETKAQTVLLASSTKPVVESTTPTLEPVPAAPPVSAPLDQEVKQAKVEAEEPADPAALWRDGVDRLKKLARESADRPNPGNDEQAKLWQARAELVDFLPDDLSAKPEPTDLTKAVGLLADAATGRETDASARSAEIESAVSTLEDRVPLGINTLQLCRKINGFGSFETMDAQSLKAGGSVLVYCELAGLRYQQQDEEFVSHVSTQVELINAADGTKTWEVLGEAEDRCRRRRRDSYVSTLITLPESIAPGSYKLRLIQTDSLAQQSATAELPVTIQR